MTVNIPEDLANSIRAEVMNGHFASEGELVTAAIRDYLQRKHGQTTPAQNPDGRSAEAGLELDTQELQRRLVDAGVLSEVKPPIIDLTPYQNRRAVPIQGEPVSDTIVRERR